MQPVVTVLLLFYSTLWSVCCVSGVLKCVNSHDFDIIWCMHSSHTVLCDLSLTHLQLDWVSSINARLRECHSLVAHTTHTHTRLTALCPGLPGWTGTRMVKPIWILLKNETVSGSGISWAVCKSALRSRQITMPAPHHSVFYRPDALPAAQPTASMHWRHWWHISVNGKYMWIFATYVTRTDCLLFFVWLILIKGGYGLDPKSYKYFSRCTCALHKGTEIV